MSHQKYKSAVFEYFSLTADGKYYVCQCQKGTDEQIQFRKENVSPKEHKRSSILKEFGQGTEFQETVTKTTTISRRSLKRVSFADTTSIKEFLASRDANTEWNHTYEEPVVCDSSMEISKLVHQASVVELKNTTLDNGSRRDILTTENSGIGSKEEPEGYEQISDFLYSFIGFKPTISNAGENLNATKSNITTTMDITWSSPYDSENLHNLKAKPCHDEQACIDMEIACNGKAPSQCLTQNEQASEVCTETSKLSSSDMNMTCNGDELRMYEDITRKISGNMEFTCLANMNTSMFNAYSGFEEKDSGTTAESPDDCNRKRVSDDTGLASLGNEETAEPDFPSSDGIEFTCGVTVEALQGPQTRLEGEVSPKIASDMEMTCPVNASSVFLAKSGSMNCDDSEEANLEVENKTNFRSEIMESTESVSCSHSAVTRSFPQEDTRQNKGNCITPNLTSIPADQEEVLSSSDPKVNISSHLMLDDNEVTEPVTHGVNHVSVNGVDDAVKESTSVCVKITSRDIGSSVSGNDDQELSQGVVTKMLNLLELHRPSHAAEETLTSQSAIRSCNNSEFRSGELSQDSLCTSISVSSFSDVFEPVTGETLTVLPAEPNKIAGIRTTPVTNRENDDVTLSLIREHIPHAKVEPSIAEMGSRVEVLDRDRKEENRSSSVCEHNVDLKTEFASKTRELRTNSDNSLDYSTTSLLGTENLHAVVDTSVEKSLNEHKSSSGRAETQAVIVKEESYDCKTLEHDETQAVNVEEESCEQNFRQTPSTQLQRRPNDGPHPDELSPKRRSIQTSPNSRETVKEIRYDDHDQKSCSKEDSFSEEEIDVRNVTEKDEFIDDINIDLVDEVYINTTDNKKNVGLPHHINDHCSSVNATVMEDSSASKLSTRKEYAQALAYFESVGTLLNKKQSLGNITSVTKHPPKNPPVDDIAGISKTNQESDLHSEVKDKVDLTSFHENRLNDYCADKEIGVSYAPCKIVENQSESGMKDLIIPEKIAPINGDCEKETEVVSEPERSIVNSNFTALNDVSTSSESESPFRNDEITNIFCKECHVSATESKSISIFDVKESREGWIGLQLKRRPLKIFLDFIHHKNHQMIVRADWAPQHQVLKSPSAKLAIKSLGHLIAKQVENLIGLNLCVIENGLKEVLSAYDRVMSLLKEIFVIQSIYITEFTEEGLIVTISSMKAALSISLDVKFKPVVRDHADYPILKVEPKVKIGNLRSKNIEDMISAVDDGECRLMRVISCVNFNIRNMTR